MASTYNDNNQLNAPKALDNKRGKFASGAWRPYNDVAEALASVVQAYRHKGLTVDILKGGVLTEYWWRDNTTDAGLVEKVVGGVVDLSNYVKKTLPDGESQEVGADTTFTGQVEFQGPVNLGVQAGAGNFTGMDIASDRFKMNAVNANDGSSYDILVRNEATGNIETVATQIPDSLSDLTDDSTHRTVTDAEKGVWKGKQNSLGYTPADQNDLTSLTIAVNNNTNSLTTKANASDFSQLNINKSIKIDAFGDSFTAAVGASDLSAGYINILKNKTGLLLSNYGVGGKGAFYGIKTANLNLPFVGNTSLVTWMVGFNDLQRVGAVNAKTQAKLKGAVTSLIASAFLKSGKAATDISVIATGTWSSFDVAPYGGKSVKLGGYGASTTSDGAYLTYNFTGNNIVIGTFGSDNSSGNELGAFDIYIDDVLVETYDPANKADGVTDIDGNTNKRTPDAVVVTGLTNGAHILKVQSKSALLTVIDYVGVMGTPTEVCPILIGTTPRVNNAYYTANPTMSEAVFAQGDAAIDEALVLFEGYIIGRVDVNSYYNLLTGVNADNIHPNDTGHYQIATAYLSRIKAPSPNSVLPTVTSGEKVISVTSSGPQKTYDILSQTVAAAPLAALDWSSGLASYSGYEGQKAYDTDYEYTCVGLNQWRRSPLNGKRIDLYMGTVDDTGGIKTSIELDSLYPSAVTCQRVYGNSGYYEKRTSIWIYFEGQLV